MDKKVEKKIDTKVYSRTENVVVSASVHRELPLEKLATQLEGAEYNPEQFPGLILKLPMGEGKSSFLLFSSGKIICTGTRSLKEAKKAIDRVVEEIESLGLPVTEKPDIEVQNMVASGSVGGPLNLNEIIFKFENTEYEPEQFPGLVYHLPNSHITFLIFGTGKVVITGGKSEDEMVEAVHVLRKQLEEIGEL